MMTDEKVPPEPLMLRTPPRPVTQLNRRVLVICIAVIAITTLGATLWSLSAERKQNGTPQTELRNTERLSRADGLERLPQTYSDATPVLGPPLPGDWGAPLLHVQQKEVIPPSPSASIDAQHQAAHGGYQREADQIASAPVLFRGTSQIAAPEAAKAESAGQPAATGAFSFAGGQPAQNAADQNPQEHNGASLNKGEDAKTLGSGTLQPPPSPYAVMAGTIIPAALLTGINSDRSGDIIAVVTQPVYDSATGRHVLVPPASRLMGHCECQITFGQNQVGVVWTRLILPDMSSITLDQLPAVDAAGYAGLGDKVDWHWGQVFAGAAVSTLIGVGAELAAPDRRDGEGRVIIATRESVQDSVNQVGQEVTKRSLNIRPTVTVRPGMPLRVIVNRDLILRPYQPLIFERSTL